jgi:hypothetical protein
MVQAFSHSPLTTKAPRLVKSHIRRKSTVEYCRQCTGLVISNTRRKLTVENLRQCTVSIRSHACRKSTMEQFRQFKDHGIWISIAMLSLAPNLKECPLSAVGDRFFNILYLQIVSSTCNLSTRHAVVTMKTLLLNFFNLLGFYAV